MLNATPLSGPGSKTGKAGRGTPIAPAYTATLRAARAAQRKGFGRAAESLFLAGQEEKLAYGASRDPAMQRLQQEAAKVAAAPTAAETAGGAPKFVEMAGATTAPTAAEPAGSFAKPATGNMLNQRLNFAKQLRESSGAGGVDLAAAAKQGKSLGLTQENVQSFLQRNELKEKPGTTAAARVGGVDGLLEEIDRMGSTAANGARKAELKGSEAAANGARKAELKGSEAKKGYLLLDRDADTPDADKFELVGMRGGKKLFAPISEVYTVSAAGSDPSKPPTAFDEKVAVRLARSKYQNVTPAERQQFTEGRMAAEARQRSGEYRDLGGGRLVRKDEPTPAQQEMQRIAARNAQERAARMAAEQQVTERQQSTARALAQGLAAEQARTRAMQAYERMAPGRAKELVGAGINPQTGAGLPAMGTPAGAAAYEKLAAAAPAQTTQRRARRLTTRGRPGRF